MAAKAGSRERTPRAAVDVLLRTPANAVFAEYSPPKSDEVLASKDYADRIMVHLKNGTLKSEIRAAYEYAAILSS